MCALPNSPFSLIPSSLSRQISCSSFTLRAFSSPSLLTVLASRIRWASLIPSTSCSICNSIVNKHQSLPSGNNEVSRNNLSAKNNCWHILKRKGSSGWQLTGRWSGQGGHSYQNWLLGQKPLKGTGTMLTKPCIMLLNTLQDVWFQGTSNRQVVKSALFGVKKDTPM